MIPQLEVETETQNIEYDVQPTKTYKFDIVNKRIQGMTDGLDAYKQAAEKQLKTMRYTYAIYSGNYGSRIVDYIGQDFDYVKSAIQREIYDTLSTDDRFRGIEDFIITQTGLDSCKINFNIVCTEGVTSMELEV